MNSTTDYIYGKNPVETALLAEGRIINKVFIYKSALEDKKIRHIKELARTAGIPLSIVDTVHKITNEKGQILHESVWAQLSPIQYADLEDLEEVIQNSLIIVANNIEDPHNLGAIIRSACAVGAIGVIIPKHRSSPVTATVVKASAGTVFNTKIIQVTNLVHAIEKLKEKGFWIIGCDLNTKTMLYDLDLKMSVALIVGNEGKGISKLVKEQCDYLVKIPLSEKVESLNVSNAACVMMYEWLRQNRINP